MLYEIKIIERNNMSMLQSIKEINILPSRIEILDISLKLKYTNDLIERSEGIFVISNEVEVHASAHPDYGIILFEHDSNKCLKIETENIKPYIPNITFASGVEKQGSIFPPKKYKNMRRKI